MKVPNWLNADSQSIHEVCDEKNCVTKMVHIQAFVKVMPVIRDAYRNCGHCLGSDSATVGVGPEHRA